MSDLNILLRHNLISAPSSNAAEEADATLVTTVMMNFSYYGFALDFQAFQNIRTLSDAELTAWWLQVEPELKQLTGDDLKIADFVVYKNFPTEVLEKSEAEYWFAQTCIYWGFPSTLFSQEIKPREQMSEQPKCKVLRAAAPNALQNILNSYLSSSVRWKAQECRDVFHLVQAQSADLSKIPFKENLVTLAKFFMEQGQLAVTLTATDALRLAAALSDGDASLREKFKFRSFKRSERKFFLTALENSSNLVDDFARRPELWKRFLHALRPGDYVKQFPQVCKTYNQLYKDQLSTFNSKVELGLGSANQDVLELLSSRPGEFRRRLAHTLTVFGNSAAESFSSEKVLSKLTNYQLVSVRRFLETLEGRKTRLFPPKGNWSRLKFGTPRQIKTEQIKLISDRIGQTLATRLPKVKHIDPMTTQIKLASSDGEVSQYTRGTTFDIPENINFIRSASYWQHPTTIWFDNGWNFFNAEWRPTGTCCWNMVNGQPGVAFSGDPVNNHLTDGRACQIIDLDLKKIPKNVRYAVWNILCYSSISFSKATEVFGALQWGEDAQKGGLFEPSRAQLAFRLKGEQMTKYVCYLDLQERKLVFMDINLKGEVQSAGRNMATLSEQMPAIVEYLHSLPSVHDLFRDAVDEEQESGYILYSDENVELRKDKAYVFRPTNKHNDYQLVDINQLAGSK